MPKPARDTNPNGLAQFYIRVLYRDRSYWAYEDDQIFGIIYLTENILLADCFNMGKAIDTTKVIRTIYPHSEPTPVDWKWLNALTPDQQQLMGIR